MHRLTILIIACFLSVTSFAQFNIGFRAGTNLSKIDGKSFQDEFSYGYLLGTFAEVDLGKKWSIQPEVLFNQIASKTDSSLKNIYADATNFSNKNEVKLNYLSIPLMLNYKVGKLITLQGGPQFGILMNPDKNVVENGKDAFDKGDLSVLGGAQINISKFRINGRYGVGLQNINDIDDKDRWTSQSIQLSVGISF